MITRPIKLARPTSIPRQFFSTFRARLSSLYVAIELLILLFAGVVLYIVLSAQAYQSMDDRLQEESFILGGMLEHRPFRLWNNVLVQTRNSESQISLIASNGITLYPSSNDNNLFGTGGTTLTAALGRAFVDGDEDIISARTTNRELLRILLRPIKRTDEVVAVLIVARSLQDLERFLRALYLFGGLLGITSMLISAYAGYHLAAQALKPLDEISTTASAVAAGDLSQRLHAFSQDTEVAQLIIALNSMFDNLEYNFEAQKRFVADVSHELRLPLAVLKGDVQVTLRKPRELNEYKDTLKQQLITIDRMHRLVEDMLTLARADAGILEMAHAKIDISLLAQECGQEHLIHFSEKNIILDIEADEELYIMGDADRITQVFYNLLGNAHKYAPYGSHILLSVQSEIINGDKYANHWAKIKIHDAGPGIPKNDQKYLFDRFYRVDESRARNAGGAGLGLTICKHIVEAHNGRIEVDSIIGNGTSFLVYLPLMQVTNNHFTRLRKIIKT
ncbi:MAG: ATP-binding protein [Mariprofundales bacterium]